LELIVQYWNFELLSNLFPREEAGKLSLNIQLMRNGLVILVDCEHGTRMKHIASASATNPMTRAGHTVMYVLLQRKLNVIVTTVYVNVWVPELIFSFSPFHRLKKP
jgi:hypothetical protein